MKEEWWGRLAGAIISVKLTLTLVNIFWVWVT